VPSRASKELVRSKRMTHEIGCGEESMACKPFILSGFDTPQLAPLGQVVGACLQAMRDAP
jgi:hypothetical protein